MGRLVDGSGTTSGTGFAQTALTEEPVIADWVMIQETNPTVAVTTHAGLKITISQGASSLGYAIQYETSVESKPAFLKGPIALNSIYLRHESTNVKYNYLYMVKD